MWNVCNGHFLAFDLSPRKTDALNAERAFGDHIAREIGGNAQGKTEVFRARDAIESQELSCAVNVTLDNVSAEASVGSHGQLEVDECAFMHPRERRAVPGFFGQIESHRVGRNVDGGGANAAHCYRIAFLQL